MWRKLQQGAPQDAATLSAPQDAAMGRRPQAENGERYFIYSGALLP